MPLGRSLWFSEMLVHETLYSLFSEIKSIFGFMEYDIFLYLMEYEFLFHGIYQSYVFLYFILYITIFMFQDVIADLYRFITFYVYYGLVVIQLVLSCIADSVPPTVEYRLEVGIECTDNVRDWILVI